MRRSAPRSPLTPEKQTLAAEYLPMARRMTRPLKDAYPCYRDEFESAACMALVEAAESFDPGRNVRFSTFARLRISGALRDVQRRQAAYGWRGNASNAPPVHSLPDDAEERGRVLVATPEPPVDDRLERSDALERHLKRLPARHAAACREIYLHGRTQAEAARNLGLSQTRVANLHRESLDRLAALLGAPARPVTSAVVIEPIAPGDSDCDFD